MKAHHTHFATGLGCLALVAFSVYYLQAAIGLLPCPLCVMQRIAFILFGITALLINLAIYVRLRSRCRSVPPALQQTGGESDPLQRR